MTKIELDRRVREILSSKVPRTQRNNMVLANTEDVSRILGKTLREVQHQYGRWDTYTLEVKGMTSRGYEVLFPDGQKLLLDWEKEGE